MSRILVISDIHANLTALETVLSHAGEVDAVWCLGDLVGYGPDPNECIEAVQQLPELVCLLGNHDSAATGDLDIATFNPEARTSIKWLREQLAPDKIEFLKSLPVRIVKGQVTLTHGSPRSPVFEYLLDTQMAMENFYYFDTPYCFVGHTHLPVQYVLPNGQGFAKLHIPKEGEVMEITPRSILNPGSVGQPRDRDPRASYAIFNPEENTWENVRIAYDVPSVQSRMQTADLPLRHIQRIAEGW